MSSADDELRRELGELSGPAMPADVAARLQEALTVESEAPVVQAAHRFRGARILVAAATVAAVATGVSLWLTRDDAAMVAASDAAGSVGVSGQEGAPAAPAVPGAEKSGPQLNNLSGQGDARGVENQSGASIPGQGLSYAAAVPNLGAADFGDAADTRLAPYLKPLTGVAGRPHELSSRQDFDPTSGRCPSNVEGSAFVRGITYAGRPALLAAFPIRDGRALVQAVSCSGTVLASASVRVEGAE